MMRLSQMIFFLCLLNVTQSHAEPMWEIRDTHIRFCKYLRTPRGNQKDAVKGRAILEVRGTYHFKGMCRFKGTFHFIHTCHFIGLEVHAV